jgi:RNA polymerase sigma-70 factor, ECF subfamily
MMASQSDTELVLRSVQGDRIAFGELYSLYHRRLLGFCVRLLNDRSQAEDVVQSVFIKALESIRSLDHPELFYHWLFSIARNEVYGVLRRSAHIDAELADDLAWETDTPLDHAVRNDTASLLESMLARLKVEYREVIVLRHLEQCSYAEIAAITGCTTSSVESRLFKARRALLQELKPYLEERTRP